MKVSLESVYQNTKSEISKKLAVIAGSRSFSSSDMYIVDLLRSQYHMSRQLISNTNDALGILQIADSALSNVTKQADRLAEISVKNGNAALSENEKRILANEATAVIQSMNDIYDNTSFNGKSVFQRMDFLINENTIESINLSPVNTSSIDLDNIDTINSYITDVNTLRGNIGSSMNKLESNTNYMLSASVNLKSAEYNYEIPVSKSLYDLNIDYIKSNTNAYVISYEIQSLKNKMMLLLV